MSRIYKKLRTESDFCDVTLVCTDSDGQKLQGHKALLASCSPVFRQMLKGHSPSQLNNNVSLFLRGVSNRNLSSILDFIYCGNIAISEDCLPSFLLAAEDLKI